MSERKKSALYLASAFLALCAVSLYRQICRNFYPGNPVYPFVVFAVYILLLAVWWFSIRSRITQKNMRVFLYLEIVVMLLWLSVRFVQETAVKNDIYLLRLLGYLISVPVVAIPLLGLYAAFGLGRAEDYRFSRKWYLLVLPAAALIVMALTNEYHHFLFRVIQGEPQPNLYFHPNTGMYLICLWGVILLAMRIFVIFRRNAMMKQMPLSYKLVPFCELIMMLLFCIPYAVSSFSVHTELIEFTAGIFFIVAAGWEACIFAGLVPVNSQYGMVFDRSTVAMQIVAEDGSALFRSARAPELDEGLFEQLKKENTVSAGGGIELHSYKIHGGYLIWQNDVSKLRSVISDLQKGADELEQEGALLREELKTRSEETRIQAQNDIYDSITEEVGGQLALLRELLRKRETAPDKYLLFRQICLIGTYVKRRCNLRLVEQENGVIAPEDLELSFRDVIDSLSGLGVKTDIAWENPGRISAEFSLLIFDILEFILEHERFGPSGIKICLESSGAFAISVISGFPEARIPRDEVLQMNRRHGCIADWQSLPGGYRLILRERGA